MNLKNLIAVVTNNDDDIYCFRKELIEAILSNGYQILICCPDGPKFDLMKNLEFIHDRYEIDRRGTNVISDLKLLVHYYKVFRKYRPKAILTYTAKPNVYATLAASALNIPTINNVTGFGSVLNESPLKRKLIMGLFRMAYRKSKWIMFQNETNMKLAQSMGMVKGKAVLIPGSGVALNRFELKDYPEGGDGKTGEPIIFNYIGRILKDKGINDYIEVAKKIKRDFPNCEFNIIGFIEPTEKDYYEPLLESLQKEGIIIYRGSQKDVRPFIERAHATIHPSTYGEGMSNVLLETAATGRVIITTDNPGCKETVISRKSGFIYPGGDVDKLIENIQYFLAMANDDRRELGLSGRQHIESKFSRNIVVKEYLKAISSIV